MPRRVDIIYTTHDSMEVAATMAVQDSELLEGLSYSERTGRIRRFVKDFMRIGHELAGTSRVDMIRGRLANKWCYHGLHRVVRRKRK
jgi:hypothetical protein